MDIQAQASVKSESVISEMKFAVARLNAASESYYGGTGELMTDFEWDALFDRLKSLEEETGIVLPDSPTAKVSSDNLAGRKESHEFAALSLAKTKNVFDVEKWAMSKPLWLSWKLDGLTLVATYDKGRLSRLVTRGDGHIGTNITHLARAISGIPHEIADNGHLVIRGEAVISYADFETYVASSKEDYANPRNLASGSLTLKDVTEIKQRNIKWIPFSLIYSEKRFSSWGEQMDYLSSLSFNVIERERVETPSGDHLSAAIGRWTRLVVDRINPFPVDGLVFCYDDVEFASGGSVTGHHATRAGLAFKWQDETASTVLKRIEWSCAVSSISPVAVFEPVSLEGTTVQRASLCNISECERLGIGGAGTRLQVIKANKIIPKVVAVDEKAGSFEVPRNCPVCSSPTRIKVSESGTKTLCCTNEKCPARKLRMFMRFVSKSGVDIDGLAGETIAKFVNIGWVKDFADIYRLNEHAQEISSMEGFGGKSAANIVSSIDKSRKCDADKLLVALSIPQCGPDVAKKLLSEFSFRELVEAARTASDEERFSDIEGIGPVKSRQFVEWCRDDDNFASLNDLLSQVEVAEYEKPSGGKCSGCIFVITGDVFKFANRNEFKDYVAKQGGKVASQVSSKTTFLVNNDVSSSSGKNKKARELGIPVISEDEFLARFG